MKVFENQERIPASSKEIFKAFENQGLLEKWWGPEGFSTTSSTFDFKPNGVWKFVMGGPDGKDYPNEMVFLEIMAPRKIVMRHTVEPHFTLTVTIDNYDGGATISWHQDFDSEELDKNTIDYFKTLSSQIGMPYQNLINLYLRDCALHHKKLRLNWAA